MQFFIGYSRILCLLYFDIVYEKDWESLIVSLFGNIGYAIYLETFHNEPYINYISPYCRNQ